MRQLADRTNIKPTRKTPSALKSSQTASGIRVLRWGGCICLPLLSKDKRVLWVHANEVNMQPDKVAELDKAFSRSPYLTHKQTAALAQRCSMHPDQVKVWFIAQRLRYSISWDYEDISEIWNKLKSNHEDEEEDEELQDMVKDDQVKNKMKSLMGRKVNCRMEQERLKEKETGRRVKGDEAATPKKRRRAVILKTRKKRMKRDVERITDQVEKLVVKIDTTENEGQTSSTCERADLTKEKRRAKPKRISSPVKNAHENLLVEAEVPLVDISSVVLQPQAQTSIAVPVTESLTDLQDRNKTPVKSSLEENTEALASLEEALPSESARENYLVAEVDEVKELMKAENPFLTANTPTTATRQEEIISADGAVLRPRSRLKTQSQLLMLRRAFLEFQYPDAEQYSMLTRLVGIKRNHLVQWFGDRRYAVKKSKPRWMTEEQYNEILANIKYRQYKQILLKGLLREAE
ncbi:homeobox and leucine zipper encoding b [Anableps anableps]